VETVVHIMDMENKIFYDNLYCDPLIAQCDSLSIRPLYLPFDLSLISQDAICPLFLGCRGAV
jgi:hypothetical protein